MGTDCIGKNVGEFGGASFVGMHAVGCANPGGPYGLTPGAIGVHVLDLPRKQITYKTKATNYEYAHNIKLKPPRSIFNPERFQ